MGRSARAWVSAGSLLATLACSRTDGGLCSRQDAVTCLDPVTALVCREGHWRPAPCPGPAGCTSSSDGTRNAFCDASTSRAGEPCVSHGDRSCSRDRAELLECIKRDELLASFVVAQRCDGPGHCTSLSPTHAVCETATAEEGDRCRFPTMPACSGDHQRMLVCDARPPGYVVGFHSRKICRGPKGCATGGMCDETIAREGDPCDEASPVACSEDGATLLRCDAGKRVASLRCDGAQGCRPIPGESPWCDRKK